MRHPTEKGKRMIHAFNMSDGVNDYRIELDAERLIWTLVYVMGAMYNDINKEKPMIMFITDLNSAFATAEQQAHPTLRGKPMGVTNRISKECCVIVASYEAKALGIKVGMRLSDASLYAKILLC